MGRVGRVEGPGELAPGPPNEPEHEDSLCRGAPIESVVKEADYLSDGEDEHEVEEQLDERDALVFG